MGAIDDVRNVMEDFLAPSCASWKRGSRRQNGKSENGRS